MKLNNFLFLNLVFIFTSCSGQNTNPSPHNSVSTEGSHVESLADTILTVFQDDNNNYWFGSRGHGVYRYNPLENNSSSAKKFIQFTTKDGLVSNDIWGIQQDKKGQIYFETQEGISKLNCSVLDTKTTYSFTTLELSNSDPQDWKLEEGDLWFRNYLNQNGPCRYDGKKLYPLEFPKNKIGDSLLAAFPNMKWSPYGIYSMYRDKRGHMWFGTSNVGIYRYDGKTLSHLYEEHLTSTAAGGSFGIRSIFEDSKGKFWFCNNQYRYDINSKDSSANGQHLISYKREKGINHKAIHGDWIYFLSISEDKEGNLWMLTFNDGIWKYDGKNMSHYTIKADTKDLHLCTIYNDKQGQLWIGTNGGGVYIFKEQSFERFKAQ